MNPLALILLLAFGFFLIPPAAYAESAPVTEEAPLEEKNTRVPKGDVVSFKVDFEGDTHWVKIQLYDEYAPKHTANFRKLASQNFYEDMAFHRVVPQFLVQTGDPLTRDESQKNLWGTGGVGYNIPPEVGLKHRRGSVGMARRSSNNPKQLSSGSQFYIMLTDAPQLDKSYTVFGQVIEGLDVVADMSRVRVDTNDVPLNRIDVDSCKVGEPGLVAAMTKPITAIPAPKMPHIPNPLSAIPNPFRKKDADTSEGEAGDDVGANPSETVVEEQVLSTPPVESTGTAAEGETPPVEKKKKSGPLRRLVDRIW